MAIRNGRWQSYRFTQTVTGAMLGALVFVCANTLGLIQVLGPTRVNPALVFIVISAAAGFYGWGILIFLAVAPMATLIFAVSYIPAFTVPAKSLIRNDRLPSGRFDAVVALSGGVTTDGGMRGQTVDRFLSATALAKRINAEGLILSRESRVVGGQVIDAEEDIQNLLTLFGNTIPVHFTSAVRSTRDEALGSWNIAKQHHWKRIIVVTSPLHTRRACATFEKVGFNVSCVASTSRDMAVNSLKYPADRRRAFEGWVYESAAAVKYRQKGWIESSPR